MCLSISTKIICCLFSDFIVCEATCFFKFDGDLNAKWVAVSLGYNVFNVRCHCSVSPLTEVFSGVTVADCHAAFDVQSCSKFNWSWNLHSIFRLLQCVIYVSKVSGICVVELAADVVSTCQICLGWIPVKKKKHL